VSVKPLVAVGGCVVCTRHGHSHRVTATRGCTDTICLPDDEHDVLETCKSKGLPQQAEVAQGVPGSLRPRIFLTFRHCKGGRSSALRAGRLYHRRNPWYSFSEAESTSGYMVLSGVPRKKSPVTPKGKPEFCRELKCK